MSSTRRTSRLGTPAAGQRRRPAGTLGAPSRPTASAEQLSAHGDPARVRARQLEHLTHAFTVRVGTDTREGEGRRRRSPRPARNDGHSFHAGSAGF